MAAPAVLAGLAHSLGALWWVRSGRAFTVALLWIPAVLWVDRAAAAAPSTTQLLLGVLTWLVLLWLLRAESPAVRAQVVVVLAVATAVEYVFSGWLGVYVYRLDQVPAYVPAGHGLVYLAALAAGRSPWLHRHRRVAVGSTVVLAGAWASWGAFLSPRPDLLGLLWYACLLGFLRWGRSTLLYVGAFAVVSYLELLGTGWGVWAWQPRDPILGWVSMGNPPSIAAGGYGWFDLYALLLGPVLLRTWSRWRHRRPPGGPPDLPGSGDGEDRGPAFPDAHGQPTEAGAGPSPQAGSRPRIASAASCSSPLLDNPSPCPGPSTPSSPLNLPPASVTTIATPATS